MTDEIGPFTRALEMLRQVKRPHTTCGGREDQIECVSTCRGCACSVILLGRETPERR